MAETGPLHGVRQEGRSRRARQQKKDADPAASLCAHCAAEFKSDLDCQWWNRDDGTGETVCTKCWLMLTQDRANKSRETAKGAATAGFPTDEEQLARAQKLVRATHTHKWQPHHDNRAMKDGYLQLLGTWFYCTECPDLTVEYKEFTR